MSDQPPSLASRMGPVPGDAPDSNAPAPIASWADEASEAAEPSAASAAAATPTTTPAPTTTTTATTDTAAGDKTDLLESQYEVAVKLADLQGDPNSPLFSVKRFEDLGL